MGDYCNADPFPDRLHFYMLQGEKEAAGVPKWILVLRIPLQFGLMYWAYWYLQF